MRISIFLLLCSVLVIQYVSGVEVTEQEWKEYKDGKPSEFRTIDVPAEEPSKTNIVYWDPMFNVTQQDWEDYKRKYGKAYSDPAEDQRHLELYIEAKITVLQHNERYEKGLETFKVDVNIESDQFNCVQYIDPKPTLEHQPPWTSEEFLKYTGTEKTKYWSEYYKELFGPHEDRHREDLSIE